MRLIFESFIYGILAALLALVIETIFGLSFLESLDITQASLLVPYLGLFILFSATTEETAKFIFARKKITFLSKTPKELALYSLVAGLGFSSIELILLSSKYPQLFEIDFIEVLKLILFHSTTFTIIGHLSAIPRKISVSIFKIILPLSLIHFAYNILVLYSQNYSLYARTGIIILLSLFTIKIFFNAKKRVANS